MYVRQLSLLQLPVIDIFIHFKGTVKCLVNDTYS